MPDGHEIEGNFQFFVQVRELDVNGDLNIFSTDFLSFPAADNSFSYDIAYEVPGEGNRLSLSFRCVFECEGVDDAAFRLETDGSFASEESDGFSFFFNSIPVADFPTTQDFQFPEPPVLQTLSGTVSLPVGVTASGDVSINLSLSEFDSNDNFVSSVFEFLTVPDGANSVDYEIEFAQFDSANQAFLSFSCGSNCTAVDGGFFTSFILQSDGTFSSDFNDFNQIPAANLPATLDFQFPEPPALLALPTVVQLPNGLVASSDLTINITVTNLDENGTFTSSSNVNSVISSGSNSTTLDLFYRDDADSVSISYSCFSFDCGNIVTAPHLFSPPSGSTFDFNDPATRIALEDLPAQAVLELVEGSPIDFQVTGGIPSLANVDVFVSGFDSNGEIVASANSNIAAQSGSIFFPVSPEIVEYQFGYGCLEFFDGTTSFDDCPNHVPANSPLVVDSFPTDVVELPFVSSINVNFEATVQTPSDSFIQFEALVSAFDESDNLIGQLTVSTFLSAGATSVNTDPFPRKIPVAPSGGRYEVEFSCSEVSDCSNYIASGDPSYSFEVAADAVPDPIVLALLDAPAAPPTLGKSFDFIATGGLPASAMVDLFITAFDSAGEVLATSNNFTDGVSGTIMFAELPEAAEYQIRYFCNLSVELVSSCPDHLPAESLLVLDSFPTSVVELPFRDAININFEARVQTPNDSVIDFNILVTVLDGAGTEIGQLVTNVFLPAGETSTNTDSFPRQIPLAPAGGRYVVQFSCNVSFDCSNYIASGDPSYTFDVQADAVPDPIVLLLLDAATEADMFEDDDVVADASVINVDRIQSHTIHEPGDIDWVRFDVLEDDTNIVLTAISANSSDDRPSMVLFDADNTEIEASEDQLSAAEQTNPILSEISFDTLEIGTYFVRLQAQSSATDDLSYTVELNIDRPQEEEICFPIISSNGSLTIVCL